LSEAVVNFIAFMGWSPKTTQELFTLNELAEQFSLNGLGKSGAIVNHEKLDWFNKQHLIRQCLPGGCLDEAIRILEQTLEKSGLKETIIVSDRRMYLERVIHTCKDRITRIPEIVEKFPFFFQNPDLESDQVKSFLNEFDRQMGIRILEALQDYLNQTEIDQINLKSLAKSLGLPFGKVLYVLRFATTGTKVCYHSY
jgi:glutamyl-tRNA synthetase